MNDIPQEVADDLEQLKLDALALQSWKDLANRHADTILAAAAELTALRERLRVAEEALAEVTVYTGEMLDVEQCPNYCDWYNEWKRK